MISCRLATLSFKTKLALAFSALVAAILAITLSIYYTETREALHESLRQKLTGIAATGALLVDPEAHAHLKTRKDENSPPYRQIKKQLQEIKKANPQVRFVYTMVKTPRQNLWMYVVDAEEDPRFLSHLGDLQDVSSYESLQKAFDGPTADQEIEKDEWGYSLSGYAPIFDKEGQAIAVLGVDMSADKVVLEEQQLKKDAFSLFGLALLLALLVGKILADRFCKPVARLLEGTRAIARGQLDHVVTLNDSVEFATLADSFNAMVEEIKTARRYLEDQAKRDGLTLLYNHRCFQDTLDKLIRETLGQQGSFCLLFCDLDNFKVFNDLYGHQQGDRILREVAQIIRETLGPEDLAFRYGGEEFALLLPSAAEAEGALVAEKIRAKVESYGIKTLPQHKFLLTISVGVAACPQDSSHKDDLIYKADRAMYLAKEKGRNQVRVYRREKANLESLGKKGSSHQELLFHAIQALQAAVEAKDHYTLEHSESVARFAAALGHAMSLPPEEIQALHLAGILHDIGKIGISDAILQKKSALTPQERKIIQTHPVVGANILKPIPNLQQLIPLILHHHERFDGLGYPEGLRGEQIPLGARVLGVADAFHAMTSGRPYRQGLDPQEAVQELLRNAGSQFDPAVVKVFVNIVLPGEAMLQEAAPAAG